jgi:hypothetical protein
MKTKYKLLWFSAIVLIVVIAFWAYKQYSLAWQEDEELYKSHPVVYLEHAAAMLEKGKMDQAVFWYYVGQMRYRLHLMANPDLEPSGDPMVFSAMKYLVGEPVNQYAGSDPDNWIKLVRKAMQWDRNHPNLYTSKQEYTNEFEEIHEDMNKLIQYVDSHRQEIRQERALNGLDND